MSIKAKIKSMISDIVYLIKTIRISEVVCLTLILAAVVLMAIYAPIGLLIVSIGTVVFIAMVMVLTRIIARC